MLDVLVACIVGAATAMGGFWLGVRHVQKQMRPLIRQLSETAVERQQLLDRIMYMADRPWAPPPTSEPMFVEDMLAEVSIWPELEAE